ncbi:MAG: UDP-glucose 4-epimerase GalE [Thermoguttaceae bacterium]|nr:UDP-glucose 4-epimerase GalE [Thermoguttaceae bacterium]MBR5760243.1 UDP-glucose 4-epimerase GalE [Thermoguttaceae bacterium]
MAVLLTGGAGYIGSHTALEFLEAGVDVVVVDNFYNSSPEAIKRVEKLTGKSVKLYEADVCDKEATRKIFEENKIDAVVHFAGYKAVGESVAKPLEYYRNNLNSALVVCELMREFGVSKIVFSSSATVYGKSKNVPFEESDEGLGCTNPYGWTKFMIEQILTDFAKSDASLSVTLLRYFNPVGAHPSGEIGEDPAGIPNNLAPYVCQVAVGKREKLNVFGNDYDTPDGTGVRDYIHVVDLARGHVQAYLKAEPGVQIFNLGTGVGYSVLDLVRAFERVNGVKIPYEIVDRRPGDVDKCYANVDRASRVLGWKAVYGLDEMCRDAYNWQRKYPNGYRG